MPAVIPSGSVAKRRAHDARHVALGSSRRLKFGVYAVEAVRAEVLDELGILYARAPWIDPTRDGIVAEQLARLIVRLRRLDDATIEDPTSVSLTSLSARTESQLLRSAEALGLTPRAAASLGLQHMDGRQRAYELAEREMAKYKPKPKRKPRR